MQTRLRTAIYKDSGDWSLWLALTCASTRSTRAAAHACTAKLDPPSPEIAAFKSELGLQAGISITASGGTL